MKHLMVAALGVGLLAGSARAEEGKDAPKAGTELKDLRQKASYSFGLDIGRKMRQQSVDLDPDALLQGIKDAVAGAKPQLTPAQIKEVMEEFGQEIAARQAETARALAEKNKKAGEAFLAANQKKEGVKTLPSGLQYKVLKSGSGKSPKATDTVKAHYEGTLIDGTVFDSSLKRGEPASFPLDKVIPGWTEALQRMKIGDKWQIVLPPSLAYGEKSPPGSPIGPNSTLIFEVELLDIE